MADAVETIGVRLGKFLASQGVSYGQFEKKTGWSNGLAGKVINKGVSFGVDKLERIFLAFPQLNPTWLVTGGENMIIESPGLRHDGAAKVEHTQNGNASAPIQANDLKALGFTDDEAKALTQHVTSTLNPVYLAASLERLLVLVEHNAALPDADKQAILSPLHELRDHLFLSVNQVIVSEAKYRAAMDAIKLLAGQLKGEAGQTERKK